MLPNRPMFKNACPPCLTKHLDSLAIRGARGTGILWDTRLYRFRLQVGQSAIRAVKAVRLSNFEGCKLRGMRGVELEIPRVTCHVTRANASRHPRVYKARAYSQTA